MIKTETSKRPTHRVYAVTKNGDKSFWTEIGAAWSHQDGKGFNVKLDYPAAQRRRDRHPRTAPKAIATPPVPAGLAPRREFRFQVLSTIRRSTPRVDQRAAALAR
jgi:hypothetical protein